MRDNVLYPFPFCVIKEHYSPSLKLRDALNHAPKKLNIPIKTKELPLPPKPDYNQCKILKDKEKFDCFPEDGADRSKCEERGCCWIPLKHKSKRLKGVSLDVPYCFYPVNYQSYKYVNMTETAFGLVAYLKRSFRSPYPNDVETVKMTVRYETENRLHIKVSLRPKMVLISICFIVYRSVP